MLIGGSGIDTAVYGDSGVRVDLRKTGWQVTEGEGKDKLSEIENLIAGSGNDKLFGNGFDNELVGNEGNDRLYG